MTVQPPNGRDWYATGVSWSSNEAMSAMGLSRSTNPSSCDLSTGVVTAGAREAPIRGDVSVRCGSETSETAERSDIVPAHSEVFEPVDQFDREHLLVVTVHLFVCKPRENSSCNRLDEIR